MHNAERKHYENDVLYNSVTCRFFSVLFQILKKITTSMIVMISKIVKQSILKRNTCFNLKACCKHFPLSTTFRNQSYETRILHCNAAAFRGRKILQHS